MNSRQRRKRRRYVHRSLMKLDSICANVYADHVKELLVSRFEQAFGKCGELRYGGSP